jgi:hypothetical protein
MAQKGLLTKKREQLELWGAISVRPEPEVAEKILAGDEEQIRNYYQAVQLWVRNVLTMTLETCRNTLEPSDEWAGLAVTPGKFDASLKRLSKGAERCMKLLYDIPDHKPTKNEERDLLLDRLRSESPDLTYGQLAIKYNERLAKPGIEEVDAKVVERAVARFRSRQALRAQRVLAAAAKYRKTHGSSDQELLEQLPTPQDVLALLTSD